MLKKVAEAIAGIVTQKFIDPDISNIKEIPNYTVELKKRFEKKTLIETAFFANQVLPLLQQKPRLLILGPPGAGKTVTLFRVSERGESIYLSLRNRSLLSAASYLSSRLSQLAGQKVISFSSADDALRSCELLMQNVSVSLLIDDSEQEPITAFELAKLEPSRCRIILASRPILSVFPKDFHVVPCNGFTPDETNHYLQIAKPSLDFGSSRVIQKSGGNPLYLSYFVQSGSEEPAPSLDDYHQAMWVKLLPTQKELVAAAALSELAPTFEGLANILSDYRREHLTGMRIHQECEEVAGLMFIQEKRVRLFHTAFRDFVIKRVSADGLDAAMHRSIANALGIAGYEYLKVFHCVMGGIGESVYEQLIPTASWAQITGRMGVARRVLATALFVGRQKRDFQMVGFALHHVAMLNQHTRSDHSAFRTAVLSEKMFKKSGKKEWLQIAKMTKATFLAEVSGDESVILLLEQVVDHYRQAGLKHREAVARANLGFVCLRRGLMGRAKKEFLGALKTFRRDKDSYGILMTLINIQGVYTAEHDWKKLRSVAKEVLSISQQLKWPRMEAGALNGFTIYYRRMAKYREAEKTCRKAIEIANSLGLADLELLQTTNLGNIFKDEKRYNEAQQCYEKVVTQGERHGFKRSIASGKELLADLHEVTGDISRGIKIGDESLKIYRELADVYRTATTLDSQASRYEKLGRPIKAGIAYHRAAEAWWKTRIIKECISSYIGAIELFLDAADQSRAAGCLRQVWKRFAKSPDEDVALGLFNKLCSHSGGPSLFLANPEIINSIPLLFVEHIHNGLLIETVASIAKVFTGSIWPSSDMAHMGFLRLLVEQYKKTPQNKLILALAIGLEQAPETAFKQKDYQEVCKSVAECLTGMNYRGDNSVAERWIVQLPENRAPMIEFQLASDDPSIRAVAGICALIIWTQRERIVMQIRTRKWCELGFTVMLFPEGEWRRKMPGTVDLSHEFPIVFTQSNVPRGQQQPMCAGIIRDDFLSLANRSQHPENKSSICAVILLYSALMGHFTHFGVPADVLNDLRGKFVCDVFGVRLPKRSSSKKGIA